MSGPWNFDSGLSICFLRLSSIFLDAVRLIKNIKRNPENAGSLKIEHFSHIGVTEVFLEATPATFVTTILYVSSMSPSSGGLQMILFGMLGSFDVLFFLGYAASILSSAFGVSR